MGVFLSSEGEVCTEPFWAGGVGLLPRHLPPEDATGPRPTSEDGWSGSVKAV